MADGSSLLKDSAGDEDYEEVLVKSEGDEVSYSNETAGSSSK